MHTVGGTIGMGDGLFLNRVYVPYDLGHHRHGGPGGRLIDLTGRARTASSGHQANQSFATVGDHGVSFTPFFHDYSLFAVPR